MSFPANPTNNQQSVINGITYIYEATARTWTRISSPISNVSVSSNLTVANANVTNNLKANLAVLSNVYVSDGLFWAGNGVSIASSADEVLRANVGAYQTWANSTFATTGGPSTSEIAANLGAYQLYANANIGTLYLGNVSTQANLGAYQSYANITLNDILSNLGAFETYANTKIGTNAGSNLVVDATTISTSTTTGALVVKGGTGIAGNAYIGGNIVVTSNISANKLYTTDGLYWSGNGTAFSSGTGLTYTADTAPPVSGNVTGDQWYNTITDVLYEYLDNGASQYWVDIQTSVIAANAVVTIPELIQANLAAFQLYANAKIGTNTDGNIVVSSGANSNYYNSAGAGKGIDIVSTFASKVGYLNLVGGSSSSGLLTFGNTAGIQAVITTGTDNSITFATKNPTTGANVASAALTLYSDQTARLSSNLTVGQSNGNIIVTNGYISGTYTPTSTIGTAIQVTGKDTIGGTGYFDFLKATNTTSGATNPNKSFRLNSTGALEVINSTYTSTLFQMQDNGDTTLAGNLTVSGSYGITMINRPAFRVQGNGGAISATTTVSGGYLVVDYNQGSHLNTTTGLFTAPVAGLYQVNIVVRTNSNTNGTINQIIIRKTAAIGGAVTSQIMIEYGTNTSMNHTGGSTIVQMAVGDTLKFDVTAGTISFDGNDNWSVAYIG